MAAVTLAAATGALCGSRAAASGGVQGWVYYGVARTSPDDRQGRTTDGGKLRPEDKGPMPDWDAIRPGDRFRTTQEVNLRSEPTSESEAVLDAPLPGRSCVTVVSRDSKAAVDLDLESGGWLFVTPVSCVAAPSAAPRPAVQGPSPIPSGPIAPSPQIADGNAGVWSFLKQNHDTLVLIGSALAALATASWAVFTFLVQRRDRAVKNSGETGARAAAPADE